MAHDRLVEGSPPVPPSQVVPLYMREADARSNFAQIDRPTVATPVVPT
jgi:hypothetical protein